MPQIEVLPSTKATPTPGWAYVPDTGYDPSKAPLNPSAPRRTRAGSGPGSAPGSGSGLGGAFGNAAGAGGDEKRSRAGGPAAAASSASLSAPLTGRSARQQNAVLKRLADLDRESGANKEIGVPKRERERDMGRCKGLFALKYVVVFHKFHP